MQAIPTKSIGVANAALAHTVVYSHDTSMAESNTDVSPYTMYGHLQ